MTEPRLAPPRWIRLFVEGLASAATVFLGPHLGGEAHAQTRSLPTEVKRGGRSEPIKSEPYQPFYGGAVIASYAVPLSVSWLALGGLFILDARNPPSTGRSNVVLAIAGASELTTLIAPPIVHWSHDNTSRGFVALSGDVLFSFFGSIVGGSGCSERDVEGACSGRLHGALVGAAVGQTIWAILDVGEMYATRSSRHRSVGSRRSARSIWVRTNGAFTRGIGVQMWSAF